MSEKFKASFEIDSFNKEELNRKLLQSLFSTSLDRMENREEYVQNLITELEQKGDFNIEALKLVDYLRFFITTQCPHMPPSLKEYFDEALGKITLGIKPERALNIKKSEIKNICKKYKVHNTNMLAYRFAAHANYFSVPRKVISEQRRGETIGDATENDYIEEPAIPLEKLLHDLKEPKSDFTFYGEKMFLPFEYNDDMGNIRRKLNRARKYIEEEAKFFDYPQ